MQTIGAILSMCFHAGLKEALTDDAVSMSVMSPQSGKLLIDTTCESAGTSSEVFGSTSETEIASDWSDLAGLSFNRKSKQSSRATQVIVSQSLHFCDL